MDDWERIDDLQRGRDAGPHVTGSDLRFLAPGLGVAFVLAWFAVQGGLLTWIGIGVTAGIVTAVVASTSGPRLRMRILALGWGLAVFTTEAGLTPDGVGGTFSPLKLAPLGLLALGAIVLMAGAPRVGNARISQPARWFAAYIIWQTVCVFVSPYPVQAALRVAQAALPLVVVIVLTTRRQSPMPLVFSTLGACAAHVLWTLRNPTYVGVEGEQRLIGLLIANSFALTCGLTIVLSIGLWQGRLLRPSRQWLLLALVGSAAYAIALSVGRTTAIAVPMAIFVGAIMFGGTPGRPAVLGGRRILMSAAFVGALFFVVLNFAAFTSWFQTGNRAISTLTGRTDLWDGLWAASLASPVFGYGPGAMRFGAPALEGHVGALLGLGQAHNSLFEALTNSGFAGAALWMASVAVLLLNAVKMRGPSRPMAVALIVALCVYSTTLGNMAGFGIGWYALMLALALVSSDHVPLDARFGRASVAPVVAAGDLGDPDVECLPSARVMRDHHRAQLPRAGSPRPDEGATSVHHRLAPSGLQPPVGTGDASCWPYQERRPPC